MILAVRDVRHRVDEAHGAVEILELPRALDVRGIGGERPAGRELRQVSLRLRPRERLHAALAGNALALTERDGRIVLADHGCISYLRAYLRSTYCSTSAWN